MAGWVGGWLVSRFHPPQHYHTTVGRADRSGRSLSRAITFSFSVFSPCIASAHRLHSGFFLSKVPVSCTLPPSFWMCQARPRDASWAVNARVCLYLDYLPTCLHCRRRLLAWFCGYLFIMAGYRRLRTWRVSFVVMPSIYIIEKVSRRCCLCAKQGQTPLGSGKNLVYIYNTIFTSR